MGEIIDKPAVGGNLGVFVGDGQGAGQPAIGVVLGGGCPGVGGDVEGTVGAAPGAANWNEICCVVRSQMAIRTTKYALRLFHVFLTLNQRCLTPV
jgi:hypothetical protein